MNRRDFLKALAIAPFLCQLSSAATGQLDPLLPPWITKDEDRYLEIIQKGLPHRSPRKHVAVLGAGMAGLVTASLLKQAGHQVTVLEMSPRIGGRVKTLREPFSPGVYIEAGAMRLPSFHRLVFAYIEKFGLPTNPFLNSVPEGYYYVGGVKARKAEYSKNPEMFGFPTTSSEQGKTAFQLFEQAFKPIVQQLKQNGSQATWQQIVNRYDQYSLEEFLLKEAALSPGAVESIAVMTGLEGWMTMAFTESVRAAAEIFSGTELHEISGGMDRLPNAFLPELKDAIRFGSEVVGIGQGDSSINIHYRALPSRKQFTLSADYAVVTIPYSILRLIDIDPQFSHAKRKVIRELTYRPSTKIFLEFRSRFWEKDGIRGGNTLTDLPIRNVYYPSHGWGEPGPAVILGSYTWQNNAMLWDSMPEADRIEYALSQLAKIHGEQVYSEFTTGASHSWLRDKTSRGGFVLFDAEQETLLTDAVSRPEGRIHFAGEHTSLTHGWIQGAIESGIRAALEVHTS